MFARKSRGWARRWALAACTGALIGWGGTAAVHADSNPESAISVEDFYTALLAPSMSDGQISAAEQQLVGWPLPASDVDLTESMRSRVATFFSAGTSKARSRGIGFSRAQMADVRLLIVSSPVAPSGGPTIPRAGTSQACEVRPPGESRPVRLAVGRAPC